MFWAVPRTVGIEDASGGVSRAACPRKESTVCVAPSGVVGGGAWDIDSWGGVDMMGYGGTKVGRQEQGERKPETVFACIGIASISSGLLCISK
jgi:hypothetical protein